jgi:acetate kinase
MLGPGDEVAASADLPALSAAGGLAFLGIRIDEARDTAPATADDYEISATNAPVRTFVIATREDKQTRRRSVLCCAYRGRYRPPGVGG